MRHQKWCLASDKSRKTYMDSRLVRNFGYITFFKFINIHLFVDFELSLFFAFFFLLGPGTWGSGNQVLAHFGMKIRQFSHNTASETHANVRQGHLNWPVCSNAPPKMMSCSWYIREAYASGKTYTDSNLVGNLGFVWFFKFIDIYIFENFELSSNFWFLFLVGPETKGGGMRTPGFGNQVLAHFGAKIKQFSRQDSLWNSRQSTIGSF